MKRITSFIFTAAIILTATGCTSTKTEQIPVEPEPKVEAAVPAKPGYKEPVMPEGEEILLDDFSEGNYWDAVGSSWDNDDAHQNLISDCDIKGEKLYCTATVPEHGSTRTAFWMCNNLIETDWTDVNYIACEVDNKCGFILEFCFTLQTTDSWNWHQFKNTVLPEGKHTILLNFNKDLNSGKFRDADDKNSYLSDVKRLNIAVFADDNVEFTIDDIRLYR